MPGFASIGLDDGGREIVRVERSGANGAIRIVPDAELGPRRDRSYFKGTVRLRPGRESYVSTARSDRADWADLDTASGRRSGGDTIVRPTADCSSSSSSTSTCGRLDRVRSSVRPGEDVSISSINAQRLSRPSRPARDSLRARHADQTGQANSPARIVDRPPKASRVWSRIRDGTSRGTSTPPFGGDDGSTVLETHQYVVVVRVAIQNSSPVWSAC